MSALEDGIDARYADFYERRDPAKVYPVEFVVRAFLGSYPRHHIAAEEMPGKRALDLGFGDGRNLPFLHDQGLEVHGVEISEEICRLTRERMHCLGVPVVLNTGHNAAIPYDDESFDYVVACHSCYYVGPGSTFDDNVGEIHRVMTPGGTFVFSAPKPDTYILRNAEALGGGHYRIVDDPYGIRNGTVFRSFGGEEELRASMGAVFEDFRIGSCDNDFWGIKEKLWIVVCHRKT